MLQISKISAITLDLDDTLWPVWPCIERAELLLQDWLRLRAPVTAGLMASVQARATLRDAVCGDHPQWVHDLSAIRLEMIRRALHQSAEDTSLAAEAFAVFFDARQQVDLFTDAQPALDTLAKRYPIIALSNGNADIHRVGIGHYFHSSLSARDCGFAKPHPHIFHAAASRMGCLPEHILHVGDDAHLDVLGALEVGMQTVWVNRDNQVWAHEKTPHLSVSSMQTLCTVLGL